MAEGLIKVIMTRDDLQGFPRHDLPPPVSLRAYRTGDIGAWVRIQQEADRLQAVDAATFRRWFGHDEAEIARRMIFLCDGDGREIGTAAAWFGDGKYEGWGQIHWVAIVPKFQGRGLAKPLVTAIMERLVELGHSRAYLTTESIRIPAIKLYQAFGFKPLIESDKDRIVWDSICNRL
ncbi:MAG: GNAT family N-acetyltransferase [Planctomycetes bacterium]|nr:GNAT family N-acetyltransferase [Planctomycetota bacterium]